MSKRKQIKLDSYFAPKNINESRDDTADAESSREQRQRKLKCLKLKLNCAIAVCLFGKGTEIETFSINVTDPVPASTSTELTATIDSTPSTSNTRSTKSTTTSSSLHHSYGIVDVRLNVEIDADRECNYFFVQSKFTYIFSQNSCLLIFYWLVFIAICDEAYAERSTPTDISKFGEPLVRRDFSNVSFPKTESRSFQPKWMDKYSWVEYSVERDAIFCYACRQYPSSSSTNNPDLTFTVNGFKSWKKALETKKGLPRHERTTYHISAIASMQEKISRVTQKKEVSALLSKNVLTLRQHYAKSILEIVVLLASKQLALRGNWDIEAKHENGLFQSLFEFSLAKDETLQKAVKLIPKNATYLHIARYTKWFDLIGSKLYASGYRSQNQRKRLFHTFRWWYERPQWCRMCFNRSTLYHGRKAMWVGDRIGNMQRSFGPWNLQDHTRFAEEI